MQYECITVCGIDLVPLPSGGYVTEPVFLYYAGKALAKLSELHALLGDEPGEDAVSQCMDAVRKEIIPLLSEAVLLWDDGKKYRYAMFSEIPGDYDEYVN